MSDSPIDQSRCGVFAIIGRPNVGKSTLLNHLLGQKLSITSRKPQTTRYRIHGIVQTEQAQLVFADTPGWQAQPHGRLHKLMNRQVEHALQDVDGVLLVIEAGDWREEDRVLAEKLQAFTGYRTVVVNKIDKLSRHADLLPFLAKLEAQIPGIDLIPVSALKTVNLDRLVQMLGQHAPVRAALFDSDQLTDRSERFVVAELIREKLTRQLGAELPYAVHVVIERFEVINEVAHIDATIWVERPGQKAIVIGKGGQRIKQVGSEARGEIEKLLARRVYLKTWVKVQGKWTENPAALDVFEIDGEE